MRESKDYKPNNSFGAIFVGPPGAGKTALALEFPEPYIIDCDNNLTGAARRFREIYKDRTFFYDFVKEDENGVEVPEGSRWERLIILTKQALQNPTVKTICIDGLGMISTYITDHIVERKSTEKRMTIQDWGTFKIFLQRYIPMCRAFGKYFILTAHERDKEDKKTGELHWLVNCPGSTANDIGGHFSDIWRIECEEMIYVDPKTSVAQTIYPRVLRTQPTARLKLKNSLGLPSTITNPTWEKLKPYFERGA